MFAYLLIIALTLPFLDFFLLLQATEFLGILYTLALILLTGLIGAELVRREGRTVFRRLTTAVTAKEASRNLIEAALLVFGGLALLTPGFITDLVGFLMVLSPTRQRIMLRIEKKLESNANFTVQTF
ncbi:FxsA family protein [Candidatus Nanohalococcus occultus]|uniref:Protein affecting phage T7 exclusion by the F plasmid n=1 Tax=Candidatus Nanohalococcus occultus TaxID=2978047 RepID=A0ABY8CCV5_9ARCH|nr:Protein affecting phage T7 exclusion by the F plasmid [Candidatus Nanohaloarchaeota archaeon SVXNc]